MAKLEKPVNLTDPFAERVGPGLAAAGTFVAKIEDIVDEFQVERRKYQSEETELVDLTTFLFRYEDPQGTVHRLSSRRMKITGHEKSTLFSFLKSILGRAPKMGWDYLEMRGHQCLLTVEHLARRDGEGVFAAVASLSPLPSGMGAAGDGRSVMGVGGTPEAAPSVEGEEELPY
jgi:hypothetical protein